MDFNALRTTAWARYRIITQIMGDILGRVISTVFYFTILVPFGIGSVLLSDPLHRKPANMKPTWLERHPVGNDIDSAMRQG